MSSGYIKLHRQILENEFYLSENFTKSQAWIDLLLLASYTQRTIFIRGIEIKIYPGQLCYSQLTLSKRWGWSDKTVKKFLELLVSKDMIDYKGGKVTTVITILNWAKYQNSTEQNDSMNSSVSSSFNESESEQLSEQLSEQNPNNFRTNKKVKKEEKEKKEKKEKNLSLTQTEKILINELLEIFCIQYREVKGIEYSLIDKPKELRAISTLLSSYRSEQTAFNNETCKRDFQAFYNQALRIKDIWLNQNMNPRIMVSQFNRIRNLIGRIDGQDDDYRTAQLIYKHFGNQEQRENEF